MKSGVGDWRVYLVTDEALCCGRSLEEIVRRALAGGADVVQLREKDIATREFVSRARCLKEILAGSGVPLIINDRIDVALAVGAEGVHVGQSDMEIADVRRLVGPEMIVGLSLDTPEQLAAGEAADVDYYGVSPVFVTPTKDVKHSAWGLEGLRCLRQRTKRHLVAIGGINHDNAAQVFAAGADSLAVVSAICAAADPTAATAALRACAGDNQAGLAEQK